MSIKYHANGLWIEKLSPSDYRIGLSEKGQDDLGEVMFVEISTEPGNLKAGEAIINAEGAKAVTELTIPFDVTVKEVHVEVEDEPDLLNSSDKEDNWLLLVTDIDDSLFNSLNTDPFAE